MQLKNCVCSDFAEKYGHLFSQWESEPLDSNTLVSLAASAVELFYNRQYVACVFGLNGKEKMGCDIVRRFKNYDMLRAMAYFALDMKKQSLECLKREIQNHNNPAAGRFISDYFESQLKTDVHNWCLENAKFRR